MKNIKFIKLISLRHFKLRIKTLILASLSIFVQFQCTNNNSALIKSVPKGDAAAVKRLLEKGANVNALNKEGETPLMIAARNGHIAVVEALITKKTDIDALSYINGITALMEAAQNGHTQIVALLLRVKANANLQSPLSKTTALILAANNGHEKIVQMLLDIGVNSNMQCQWTNSFVGGDYERSSGGRTNLVIP